MLGEELNSSYLTERGLVGDRSYVLIDQETGKVASAKNPRKWGKLFDFRAAFMDTPQVVESIPLSGLPSQMAPTFTLIRLMILIMLCQRFLVERLDS